MEHPWKLFNVLLILMGRKTAILSEAPPTPREKALHKYFSTNQMRKSNNIINMNEKRKYLAG